MEQLAGKVAVVTGAASGIGLALAKAFAAEQMKVVLADIEQPALLAAAGDVNGETATIVCDVSSADQVASLRDRTIDRFGQVNVVCNNAGVGGGGLLAEATLRTWQWTLGVNLWGVVHGVHHFLPHLLEHGDGHIVNTGSIAGLTSFPGMGPYNVSKHAVVTLTETLHQELVQSGSTVGATVLCPGFVATNILDSARNRPETLLDVDATPDPEREQLLAVARELYAGRLEPAVVAAKVVAAIRANQLYCYTDDQFAPVVAERHRHIEAATNPPSMGTLFDNLM